MRGVEADPPFPEDITCFYQDEEELIEGKEEKEEKEIVEKAQEEIQIRAAQTVQEMNCLGACQRK